MLSDEASKYLISNGMVNGFYLMEIRSKFVTFDLSK